MVTSRQLNRIVVEGEFSPSALLNPLREIQRARAAGFESIDLDFSSCSAAFAPAMIALCTQAMRLRGEENVSFNLTLPKQDKLARHFKNTNWAHFISPTQFARSGFRNPTSLAATQFTNASEQKSAVDQIISVMLGTIPNIVREDFDAFEWALNEITDNVLVHSGSSIGGIIQASTLQNRKRVEFVVADGGAGIPGTLRPSHPDLKSDEAALASAIKEGVTRDREIGQGNGLYGTFSLCSKSRGSFYLESGSGRLLFDAKSGLRTRHEAIPFHGTLVTAELNFADQNLLAQALRFSGRPYRPTGTIELKYEYPNQNEVVFRVQEETASTGSRMAGTPLRTKLLNLIQMFSGETVVIDFAGVPLISSSFADEVLGKLFLQLGPLTFSQYVKVRNASPNIQQLIDKAILQRMRQH